MRVKDSELVDNLLPFVRSFSGMAGGGGYSFQLLCGNSRCYRQDTISANANTFRNERQRRKACLKLISQGWTFSDRPVCPECSKETV